MAGSTQYASPKRTATRKQLPSSDRARRIAAMRLSRRKSAPAGARHVAAVKSGLGPKTR